MKDFSNYKRQADMKMVSAKIIWKKDLKAEGCNIAINHEYKQIIDDEEKNIFCIVKNFGIEQKNDLEERLIYYDKFYDLNKGDYVTYNDEIYLATSKRDRDNPVFDTIKITFCNQVITLPNCPLQYAYLDDSSYGQKGVIDSNNLTYIDGQIKALTQDNIYTRAIPLGYRLIFDNSENEIFEVVKNDKTTTKDVRRIMLKRVDYDATRDNLETNLAYNNLKLKIEEDEPEVKPEYVVKDTENYLHNEYCPTGYDGFLGMDYKTKIYVTNSDGDDLSGEVWSITSNVDEINSKCEIINIIEIGNNYIEIENIGGANLVDLEIKFKKDDIELPIKIRLEM